MDLAVNERIIKKHLIKYCNPKANIKVSYYDRHVLIEMNERKLQKKIYYFLYERNDGIYTEIERIGLDAGSENTYHFMDKKSEEEALKKFNLDRETLDQIIIKLKK